MTLFLLESLGSNSTLYIYIYICWGLKLLYHLLCYPMTSFRVFLTYEIWDRKEYYETTGNVNICKLIRKKKLSYLFIETY